MSITKQIPPDFHLFAAQPYRVLEQRFHVTRTTIKRWRKEVGVTIQPGAPKGNRNALQNASRKKQTHGIDGIDAVRTCLSCTRERCTGSCSKVR